MQPAPRFRAWSIGGRSVVGTGMAKPKRRPGYLQDRILRILQDQPRPLSGLELAEILREEGDLASPSLVFRAIRRLIDRRAIRKILVAGGYAAVREGCTIRLFCSQCGDLREIPGTETFDALDSAAAASGFGVSNYIVEVEGICRRCVGNLPLEA